MQILNVPKAVIVLAALFCITLLMLFERIDGEAAFGLLGMIVGYGVGNGIAARAGDQVQPIIGSRYNDHKG